MTIEKGVVDSFVRVGIFPKRYRLDTGVAVFSFGLVVLEGKVVIEHQIRDGVIFGLGRVC